MGTDQALAVRILALAKSSDYGLPRRISSLREAVVFLGFKAIRNLAMAITTFNLFLGKSDLASLSRRTLWRHSMDTAQCARIITSHLHPSDRELFGTDEAFTCGLLHDIGKLALDKSRPTLFTSISEAARTHGLRFFEIEQKALPWTHCQIGMALAARWNLPAPVCETIGFHHTPLAAQMNPHLTSTSPWQMKSPISWRTSTARGGKSWPRAGNGPWPTAGKRMSRSACHRKTPRP